MTLANRVSAFFLGWLGLSLVGFALAAYLVARADLYREVDARLESTLDALNAAADFDPEGIEWEAHERTLPRGDGPNSVYWMVAAHNPPDDRALIVDRSGPGAEEWLWAGAATGIVYDPASSAPWRVARRRLDAGPVPDRPRDRWTVAPEPNRVVKYRTIEIVAGVPLTPIRDELRRLAIWLAIPTVGVWLVAALIGRWLCRRTLAPVAEMAAAARTVGPSAGERLRVRPTGDELEDLGRSFNGALDRLEEAFERQRRYTEDASHQLRTPLAAMLGQVEVALRRDRDGPEYRNTLVAIADEIRHLNCVTDALLFLARADVEAGRPDLQQIDPVAWVNAFVADWRSRYPQTRIDVVADVPASTRVRAHPELLAQMLENLVDNAVKYAPTGSPVTVRVTARDGGTELAIEDAGPGIAPADLPHVFEPFFRSAAAREAGVRGVGLGLAIARRIGESMGARLTAESKAGGGSRFVVWFPGP